MAWSILRTAKPIWATCGSPSSPKSGRVGTGVGMAFSSGLEIGQFDHRAFRDRMGLGVDPAHQDRAGGVAGRVDIVADTHILSRDHDLDRTVGIVLGVA